MGRFIERTQKITEIIDTKYHILLPSVRDVGGAVDTVQWAAVLKSCSAYEAYYQSYLTQPEPRKIVEMLYCATTSPGLSDSVDKIHDILRKISQTNEAPAAEQGLIITGEMKDELATIDTEHIIQIGMHEYLKSIQNRLKQANEARFSQPTYSDPQWI